MEVSFLESAAGVVEGAELDGDAGADSDEWGEGAFVEGEGAFVGEDGGGAGQGGGVCGGGLEADFDYVEWLTWKSAGSCQSLTFWKARTVEYSFTDFSQASAFNQAF